MHIKSHTYSKEDITVLWQRDICIHSGICARGLSEVFNPRKHPWINLDNAAAELIKKQVKKCPSGALSLKE